MFLRLEEALCALEVEPSRSGASSSNAGDALLYPRLTNFHDRVYTPPFQELDVFRYPRLAELFGRMYISKFAAAWGAAGPPVL